MNFRQIKQKETPRQGRELDEYTNNSLLSDLLSLRGIVTQKDAQDFFECTKKALYPFDVFQDYKKAIDRIKTAIEKNQKILVWGDFDADGVTSSALMHKTLNALGANFEIFIPERIEHGHGINSKTALQLVSKSKVKVLITVDCGISNASEISLLKSLGVDVIITDHHKLDGEKPSAYAVLNPQAPDSLREDLDLKTIEDLSNLAGVGVAYKLACALLGNDDKHDNLKDELAILACVGTISDVVPLLGENRTIVAQGLDLINQNKHLGIKKLFGTNSGKIITSTDIAFILTPRINAAGRLSTPKPAFDFLVEQNESTINFILEKLDNYNKIRQSLCEEIFTQARNMVLSNKNHKNERAIILFCEEWHIGIIGIVASKLLEEFLKPVFLITSDDNNHGRCSIRSLDGYNVYEILKKNSKLFLGFGGHALAGGFSFDLNEHGFDEIKSAILKTIDEYDFKTDKEIFLEVDKFLDTKEINKNLLETISKLEPFGQNNPAPLFALKDCVLKSSKMIGKNSNHLKFFCQKDGMNFECVKWNEDELKIPNESLIDIAFQPRLNSFNGEETIQLEICDIYSDKYTPAHSNRANNKLKIYDHRKKTGILNQISDYLRNEELDITVWAKNLETIAILKKYPEIEKRFSCDDKIHESIMFFNYPSCYEELKEVLSVTKPAKVHFMAENCTQDIEYTIKTISGMLKYSNNHKNGEIDIVKIAQTTGTSEVFIQLALEIFEARGAIEILDVDKIRYIAPAEFDKLNNHSLWEVLLEEFDKIKEFKKHLAEDDIDKMYELLYSCLD